MRRIAWIALLALLAFASAPAGARAEEWVLISAAEGGTRFEVDIGAVVMDGDVAQAWVRETPRRPQRESGGKLYVNGVTSRFDDCKNRRFDLGASIYHDSRGAVVARYPGPSTRDWNAIGPGSVGERMHGAICGLGRAQAVGDIREGDWQLAGDTSQKDALLYVLMDGVLKVDDDRILVMTRADYRQYQYLGAVPYRYEVIGNLIDCRRRQIAIVEQYLFSSPVKLVSEDEVEASKVELIAIPPGTYAYSLYEKVCNAPALSPEEPQQRRAASGAGTAWATNKGYLVTSAHVVEGAASITVHQNGEKLGAATVVVLDPANDLAVLKFSPPAGRRLRIIPLADRSATLGRTVFTLGYPAPGMMGQRIKMTSGEVSSTSGIRDDARYLQISVPVQPGNSGGPLLGFDGAAVGVVASKLPTLGGRADAPAPENVNYAVKVAYLRPLLEDLPDLGDYDTLKAGATADDLIAQAQEAVFMIVVSAPQPAASR